MTNIKNETNPEPKLEEVEEYFKAVCSSADGKANLFDPNHKFARPSELAMLAYNMMHSERNKEDNSQAEWIDYYVEDIDNSLKGISCSECDAAFVSDFVHDYGDSTITNVPNYCPNCGRKMQNAEQLNIKYNSFYMNLNKDEQDG